MSKELEKGCDEVENEIQADEVQTPFGLTECIVSLNIPSDVADQRYVAIGGGCVGCHS
ncbi:MULTISPECIES: hypothetical protein [Pseudomonas]|uniref:Uncharacterized protein n=1 Tax=Pseudomonas aphyarum TaxID=2942629 RepID=A0ABT5PTP6_9PSED|nr:hypothetical protein [Pseudomonas aphyarum]MDD0969007.1 hypothetical protein [Pseudomonas aphyarum]MDD1126842.1 hypothetical protein [Pseudomonas aphyarum]